MRMRMPMHVYMCARHKRLYMSHAGGAFEYVSAANYFGSLSNGAGTRSLPGT